MNTKNTLALFTAFPRLYRGRAKPLTESLMAFGFECEDGWFQIIWELSEALEMQAAEENRTDEDWPEVLQVKEKFGTLRYYMAGLGEGKMSQIIQEAEDKSAVTCEVCGTPGTLCTEGWFYTACPKHSRKR